MAARIVAETLCVQVSLAFTGMLTAVAQSSLTGGTGGVPMQISKVVSCPEVPVKVYTLTIYSCPGVSPTAVLLLGSLQ